MNALSQTPKGIQWVVVVGDEYGGDYLGVCLFWENILSCIQAVSLLCRLLGVTDLL